VEFVIMSQAPFEVLQKYVDALIAEASKTPGLQNLDSDLRLDKPELKVSVNREKISDVGASVEAVGRTLETMLGGRQVTRFKKDGEQYDVIVRSPTPSAARPRTSPRSTCAARQRDDQALEPARGARVGRAEEPEPLQPHPRRHGHRNARARATRSATRSRRWTTPRARCCRPRCRPT
jgi:hypothetical protein